MDEGGLGPHTCDCEHTQISRWDRFTRVSIHVQPTVTLVLIILLGILHKVGGSHF